MWEYMCQAGYRKISFHGDFHPCNTQKKISLVRFQPGQFTYMKRHRISGGSYRSADFIMAARNDHVYGNNQ